MTRARSHNPADGHFQPSPPPVASPQEEVLPHLRQEIKYRLKRHRKTLKRCQKKFSEKSIHDFRVEIRRLMSVLEIACLFERRIKPPRKALKYQLDLFDKLRDIQVQSAQLKSLAGSFPAAKKLRKKLKKNEESQLETVRKQLDSLNASSVEESLDTLRNALRKTATHLAPDHAQMQIRRALVAAFEQVNALRRKINPASPESIHQTRIAFKSFRYMAEALAPFLPHFTPQRAEALHHYQSMMGEIQDAEVLFSTAHDFFSRKPASGSDALLAELEKRKADKIAHFLENAAMLDQFRPVED